MLSALVPIPSPKVSEAAAKRPVEATGASVSMVKAVPALCALLPSLSSAKILHSYVLPLAKGSPVNGNDQTPLGPVVVVLV